MYAVYYNGKRLISGHTSYEGVVGWCKLYLLQLWQPPERVSFPVLSVVNETTLTTLAVITDDANGLVVHEMSRPAASSEQGRVSV